MPKVTVKLNRSKECKHSIVFATKADDAAVSTIYINKTCPGIERASSVTLEIECAGSVVREMPDRFDMQVEDNMAASVGR